MHCYAFLPGHVSFFDVIVYHIAQNFDGGNIDGLALFRSLTGKIVMDSLLENLYLLIQLENAEREIFDGLLTERQIRQCFLQSKFCTIRY